MPDELVTEAPAKFPGKVKLTAIRTKHPEYVKWENHWRLYDALMSGGAKLKGSATAVLTRRVAEDKTAWEKRLERFAPDSPLASALSWYSSELFSDEPGFDFAKKEQGGPNKEWFERFRKNADRAGTDLVEVAREAVRHFTTYCCSWVHIDRPKLAEGATLADDRQEENDPYVVMRSPLEVINWSEDKDGLLEKVVIETHRLGDFDIATGKRSKITDFFVYDREEFAHYQHVETPEGAKEDFAALQDEGRHPLAEEGIVPVLRLTVSPQLWLADRAGYIQSDMLNADSELSWAMNNALLAQPWIKTKKADRFDAAVPRDGVGLMLLEPEDEVGYLQQEVAILADGERRVAAKKDAVLRAAHLLPLARDAGTTSMNQSGVSKEMDFRLTMSILEGMGDQVKKFLIETVNAAAKAGGREIELVDIRGLHFTPDEAARMASTNLQDARLLGLETVTPTAIQYLRKVWLQSALADAQREVKEGAIKELEDAPSSKEEAERKEKLRAEQLAAAAGGEDDDGDEEA